MSDLILEIKKGGLGDHLFYSHIPRIAKETGAYKRVYISTRSLFRSDDTKRLVWETNPHLDGFCESAGVFPEEKADFKLLEGENLLDRIMLELGIDDGKRFHNPEVAFIPTQLPRLKEATVYDPNFISWVGDLKPDDLKYFVDKRGIKFDYQMKLRQGLADTKALKSFQNVPIKGLPELCSQSLEEFCSIIVSSKEIYCLTTGTATLAAALNKPVKVLYGVYHDPIYRHCPLHEYIFVPKKPLSFLGKQYCRFRNLTRKLKIPAKFRVNGGPRG